MDSAVDNLFSDWADANLLDGEPKRKAEQEVEADDEFECFICMLHMRPPFRQCSNGHPQCADCLPKLPRGECAKCRANVHVQGALHEIPFSARIVKTLSARCLHPGCSHAGLYGQVAEHERHCEYAPFACPLSDARLADWMSGKDSGTEIAFRYEDSHACDPATLGKTRLREHLKDLPSEEAVTLTCSEPSADRALRSAFKWFCNGSIYMALVFRLERTTAFVTVFRLYADILHTLPDAFDVVLRGGGGRGKERIAKSAPIASLDAANKRWRETKEERSVFLTFGAADILRFALPDGKIQFHIALLVS